MGEYRLSLQARRQIREIGKFTLRQFGLLVGFPKMGVAADELLSGARRFRFQSHDIFYTEDTDSILIRGVFHIAQNVRPDLFDER